MSALAADRIGERLKAVSVKRNGRRRTNYDRLPSQAAARGNTRAALAHNTQAVGASS
jgi:hypothetical protein